MLILFKRAQGRSVPNQCGYPLKNKIKSTYLITCTYKIHVFKSLASPPRYRLIKYMYNVLSTFEFVVPAHCKTWTYRANPFLLALLTNSNLLELGSAGNSCSKSTKLFRLEHGTTIEQIKAPSAMFPLKVKGDVSVCTKATFERLFSMYVDVKSMQAYSYLTESITHPIYSLNWIARHQCISFEEHHLG